MKTRILVFLYVLATGFLSAQTNPHHIWVDTYSRDGRLVQGHYRTGPNSTNRDNFSTKGNVNPYTMQPGWITPDNIPLADPRYSYRFDTSTRFDSSIDDCSAYFFGPLRIGQFQEIKASYKRVKTIDTNHIYEVRHTYNYDVQMVVNANGFMIGYIIETDSYNVALQIIQNLINYHSLPDYSSDQGVVWVGEDFSIVYVKLDNNSQRIMPDGKYRFSVAKTK